MEKLNGLLRVRVIRGVNLAVRDLRSSDPYVIVKMGKQKLRTRVVKRNLNPEWNESLTLSVSDHILPIRIEVFDKDTFSRDDPMGYAEFDIHPFIEAVEMKANGVPCNQIHKKLVPNRQNCYAEESCIKCVEGKIIQDLCLRLRNVECGEVEIQLEWINIKSV
ncbi:GTPase activating protein 1 [Nymphaea thermarum]|nr:GTPase activating protein 1 [Nymphaea thermarum]